MAKTLKFTTVSVVPPFPVSKEGSSVIDSCYYGQIDRGEPIYGLGSGDSSVILDLTRHIEDPSKSLFELVRDEVTWEEMFHKGNPVPRLVCMQGTIVRDANGVDVAEPVYRHPADAQPPMFELLSVIEREYC